MKKKLAVITLAGLMGVLTACGSGNSTAATQAQTEAKTEAVTEAKTEAKTETETAAQTDNKAGESSEGSTDVSGESETAAQSASKSETDHYPVTISTFNFNKEPVEETFMEAPKKVITAWQNSVETMLALGLEDNIISIIGVSEDDISPSLREAYAKIKDKEFNDFTDSNAAMSKEAAIMLEPDFILAWKSTFSDKSLGDVDYWQENGVNTYMALNSNDISENRTVDNEYQDILTVGKIFNVEDKAQVLVDEMKASVDKVTLGTEGQEKKKVLIIEFLGDTISIYDKTSLAGDMVTKMGGELVDTAKDISAEDIVNLDPDVIFTIHMDGYGEGAGSDAVKSITENPAYSSLKAVKDSQVFPLNLSDVYTSGIRTIDGLNAIGKALYPELYQD